MALFARKRSLVPAQSAEALELMSQAGTIVAQALAACREASAPGVSTEELNTIAEDIIRSHQAVPSFKGYHGFPGAICSSINDVVVHGIPSPSVILEDGDLVSIDCGAIFQGWHGDAAMTWAVGDITEEQRYLNELCEKALHAGIAAMKPGNRLTDISAAIESAVSHARKTEPDHYGDIFIVSGFGGHGIGEEMHLDPYLANEGAPGHGPDIIEGSTLAIEPMLALGTRKTHTDEDGWTVRTRNGLYATHWEHTVAATASGPRILTTV